MSQHTFRFFTDQCAPEEKKDTKKTANLQFSTDYLHNVVTNNVSDLPCGGEATASNIKRQPVGMRLSLFRATEVFLGI